MSLALMQLAVTGVLLFLGFVAGCAWYSRIENSEQGAPVLGSLALMFLMAGAGYGAVAFLMGPMR